MHTGSVGAMLMCARGVGASVSVGQSESSTQRTLILLSKTVLPSALNSAIPGSAASDVLCKTPVDDR